MERKDMYPYVILIPKRQWRQLKKTGQLTGVYQSTFDALEECPTCSRIMPMYDFFIEINKGLINIKDNWVVRVDVEQTLADYYNKTEAR